MVQMQSATSAPGQQNQHTQDYRFRNTYAPANQQGATGQGSSSSTNTTGLGAGAGPYGVSHRDYAEVRPILTGTSSRRCLLTTSDTTLAEEGHLTEAPVGQDVLEASEAS